MTSGANQSNSADKSRSKQLRKSSKRPSSSMQANEAKQMRHEYDEQMDGEASSSGRENNLVENFKYQQNDSNERGTHNERLKKKLIIKNFQTKKPTNGLASAEDNNIDNAEGSVGKDWGVLVDNVCAILEDRKTLTTLEALFAKVRAVCDKNQSKPLYDRLIEIIANYANKLKKQLDEGDEVPLVEENCEQFLGKFGKIWDAFPLKINLIRNIFLYLDRIGLTSGDTDFLPLWDSSMQIFQRTFFPQISKEFKSIKLFSALYMAMHRMMMKYTVDSPLRSLVDMLQTIHVADQFSDYLLAQLREHYNKERVQNVPVMTCDEYMEYAEDQINRYSSMVKVTFDEPSALRDVQATVLNSLIQQAIPEVLTHNFDQLLDSGNISNISRMFDLCRQCPGGEDEVRSQFSKYMKQQGAKIVATCPDDDLVTELLGFKKKIDLIMAGSFKTSADPTKMRQCLSDAFETFVNKDVDKAAELIAKHFHGLLHSGNKSVTDDTSLDQMVDDAIILFRYMRGKDVFEAYYKRGLSKRLFLERSASVDAEKMVLCKLKTECGAAFTYKLEGMFKDMDTSENLGQLFVQYLEHHNRDKVNFSVRVITPEYWPTYDPYEINIPKEMRNTLTDYQDFYRAQHGNRNVKWNHGLATAVVSAEFRQGCKKELVGTLYQAVILLLFNKCEKWTVDEMVECTKLPQMEVVKNVLSLLGGRDRPRVLLRHDSGVEKKESTVETVKNEKLVVNSAFADRRCRIRLAQVNIKTVVEEKKEVEAEVNHDRQYQIDAAVVRIMKARKDLTHTVLMTEVMNQLKFPVKATDIKVRIGSLIEREYISRDPEDSSKYKYVA